MPPTSPRQALETGFPELDLIRFGAALMVALYHYLAVGPGRIGAEGAGFRADFAPVHDVAATFWVAVPVFFVLSGVVIAFSAEGRGALGFVRRRVLRLYPAAWICATVTVLLWPHPGAAMRYLRSLALWPEGPWVSDVYWTLAVEVAFYALVALALAVGGRRWVTGLGVLLAAASASWWGLRGANALAGDALRPLLDLTDFVVAADGWLLRGNAAFFGLGILLYALARGPRPAWMSALAAAAALAGLLQVYLLALGIAGDQAPAVRLWLGPAIWGAAAAGMLWSLFRALPPERGWPRGLRWIGLATYPLYLVHAELGMWLMLAFAPLGSLPALLLALAGVLAAVAAIMWGEIRIRRPLARLLPAERPAGAGAERPDRDWPARPRNPRAP